jgi:hypothetical protein
LVLATLVLQGCQKTSNQFGMHRLFYKNAQSAIQPVQPECYTKKEQWVQHSCTVDSMDSAGNFGVAEGSKTSNPSLVCIACSAPERAVSNSARCNQSVTQMKELVEVFVAFMQ